MAFTKIKTPIKKASNALKKSDPLKTPKTYLEAERDATRALGKAYKGMFLLGATASLMFTYTEGKKMLVGNGIGETLATFLAIAFAVFIFKIVDITLSKVSPLAFMSILNKKKSTKRGIALLVLCVGLGALSMVFSKNGAKSPMQMAFSHKKGKDIDLAALRAEANEEKEQVKKDYATIISSAQLQDQQKLEALKQDSAKLVSECLARNARYNYSESNANKYLQRAKEAGADKVATYSPIAPAEQQKLLNKLDDIDLKFEEHKKELKAQKSSKDKEYHDAVAIGSILTNWLGVGSTLLAGFCTFLFVLVQMPVNQAKANSKADVKHVESKTQAGQKDALRRKLRNKAYSSLNRLNNSKGDINTNVKNIVSTYEQISHELGQDELTAFWNQLASSNTYTVFHPDDLVKLLK